MCAPERVATKHDRVGWPSIIDRVTHNRACEDRQTQHLHVPGSIGSTAAAEGARCSGMPPKTMELYNGTHTYHLTVTPSAAAAASLSSSTAPCCCAQA
jgi:hypothetical protein